MYTYRRLTCVADANLKSNMQTLASTCASYGQVSTEILDRRQHCLEFRRHHHLLSLPLQITNFSGRSHRELCIIRFEAFHKACAQHGLSFLDDPRFHSSVKFDSLREKITAGFEIVDLDLVFEWCCVEQPVKVGQRERGYHVLTILELGKNDIAHRLGWTWSKEIT